MRRKLQHFSAHTFKVKNTTGTDQFIRFLARIPDGQSAHIPYGDNVAHLQTSMLRCNVERYRSARTDSVPPIAAVSLSIPSGLNFPPLIRMTRYDGAGNSSCFVSGAEIFRRHPGGMTVATPRTGLPRLGFGPDTEISVWIPAGGMLYLTVYTDERPPGFLPRILGLFRHAPEVNTSRRNLYMAIPYYATLALVSAGILSGISFIPPNLPEIGALLGMLLLWSAAYIIQARNFPVSSGTQSSSPRRIIRYGRRRAHSRRHDGTEFHA